MWQVLVTLGGSKYFLKTLLFMRHGRQAGRQAGTAGDIPYQNHQLQIVLANQENDVQRLTETDISYREIKQIFTGGRTDFRLQTSD